MLQLIDINDQESFKRLAQELKLTEIEKIKLKSILKKAPTENRMAKDSIVQNIDDLEMEESGPLFWSMKLEPGEAQEIDQPAIAGYIVRVTNACFGLSVAPTSRTVIMVNPSVDESDTSLQAPVAVLKQNHHENQSLDLLFNGMCLPFPNYQNCTNIV